MNLNFYVRLYLFFNTDTYLFLRQKCAKNSSLFPCFLLSGKNQPSVSYVFILIIMNVCRTIWTSTRRRVIFSPSSLLIQSSIRQQQSFVFMSTDTSADDNNNNNSMNDNGNILVLSESNVRECLSLDDCIEANKKALMSLADGTGVVPARLGIPYHTKNNNNEGATDVTLFKPASYQNELMGMKVVSIRKENSEKNLPLVPATIVSMNAETGMVNAIVASTYLTAARTAAASALATQYVLNSKKQQKETKNNEYTNMHLILMGAGLQIELHCQMLMHILPKSISKITIINRSYPRAHKLKETILSLFQHNNNDTVVNIVLWENVTEIGNVLSTANIIVTATNTDTPLISTDVWDLIPKGCHINGVGSYTPQMEEVCSTFLKRRCPTILVDTMDAITTVGDLKQSNPDNIHLLGSVLSINANLDTNDCTFFKSVGTAIQDVVTSHTVVQAAKQKNIGTYIPMT